MEDLILYEPRFVWAIFQYDDSADFETWNFHSAHWSRDRARYFAKALDGKTRVRKITYEVVPNAEITGSALLRSPR